VTWGILAYLATTPQARRVLSVVAAVFALGVGATTVYLGTHWVSDVVLGWAAGLLILLALPWSEPAIAWAEAHILAVRDRLRSGRGLVPAPVPAGGAQPPLVPQRHTHAPQPQPQAQLAHGSQGGQGGGLEPVGAGNRGGTAGGSQAVRNADARLHHHPPRPHITRSERTPVTPTGSRRPPHLDRTPRTAPLGSGTQRGRAGG
jgi:PAP2 superfamily protein